QHNTEPTNTRLIPSTAVVAYPQCGRSGPGRSADWCPAAPLQPTLNINPRNRPQQTVSNTQATELASLDGQHSDLVTVHDVQLGVQVHSHALRLQSLHLETRNQEQQSPRENIGQASENCCLKLLKAD